METNSGVIEICEVMGREELCLKNMSSKKTTLPQAESWGSSGLYGPVRRLMKKSEKEK